MNANQNAKNELNCFNQINSNNFSWRKQVMRKTFFFTSTFEINCVFQCVPKAQCVWCNICNKYHCDMFVSPCWHWFGWQSLAVNQHSESSQKSSLSIGKLWGAPEPSFCFDRSSPTTCHIDNWYVLAGHYISAPDGAPKRTLLLENPASLDCWSPCPSC